uniref:disabled homolog 2 isoform X1 n=1 Tax=Oncorhynchus gorbuscha TaxID=8017 RepID=UPI001EAF1EB4|nr:disabled homolog 2 isoform X1 [Oncorhynchus gorbuscha]XP_046162273.1 disabled homolog 2 isoform X1 [Oncorhynchus gorbuscha]
MSTEVASNTPVVPADPSSTPSPTTSIPTTPSAAPAKTPFKKEKKKAPEKTDEYLLSRFQGDGVRYRAKLIGIDDVPEARGDKMSQDSMMKLKGLAIASRSQGKHKQRIWVNISMSGIKIIDEKTGVIEHEHMVNKISFIARDVTDNRAFGYVCGAEGQHQFFAIKTGQQAEPLVIDLKDLFQVIFNMKKESEASQKDQRNNATVENGGNTLLSIDGQAGTAKEVQQLDLFGDMSTPPDIHSPTETNDILLLDLSAEVDSNQNCIKGNPFTSYASNLWGNPQTENPFSSTFGFFPTPDSDPFSDDPLAQSATPNSQISAPSTNHSQESSVHILGRPVMNDDGLTGDSDHSGQQLNGLSNKNMILALSNCQWPLGGAMSECRVPVLIQNGLGPVASPQNPFLDISGEIPSLCNSVLLDPKENPPMGHGKDSSVVISLPPQNTKAGRGRRSAKCPPADDLFGADMFAAPSQPDSSSASNDLFSPTTSSMAALGTLQLGSPSVTIPRTAPSPWGAPASSMFTMPGGVTLSNPQPTFPQPSAFSALPIPPAPWGQQAPSPYGAPPVSQAWGQPAPAGPMGAPGWGQPPMANLFQPEPYTMIGGPLQGMPQGPPRPPPRPPVKEAPAKVEPSAFTALDPLGGEKEKKSGKDMFKDFQIAKPPAIPARKGEQIPGSAAPSTNGDGVFAQYFSSKVGVPQEIADHDDFEIQSRISAIANDPIKPAPLHSAPMISLAVVPGPGLLDAFAPTPATFLAPAAAGLNQNLFDDVFGSATPNAFGAPLLATTTSGSDPFGDPFA